MLTCPLEGLEGKTPNHARSMPSLKPHHASVAKSLTSLCLVYSLCAVSALTDARKLCL